MDLVFIWLELEQFSFLDILGKPFASSGRQGVSKVRAGAAHPVVLLLGGVGRGSPSVSGVSRAVASHTVRHPHLYAGIDAALQHRGRIAMEERVGPPDLAANESFDCFLDALVQRRCVVSPPPARAGGRVRSVKLQSAHSARRSRERRGNVIVRPKLFRPMVVLDLNRGPAVFL